MFRYLIVLVLAGLLAACANQGGGASNGAAGSSASSGAPSSAGASGGAAGTASAACAEAFAPLAELEITSMSELGDLQEEVQPTVEACESVADWIAGAQEVVADEVRPGTADFLLRVACNDLSLARTQVCEELASS